jgi:hypothetical protein
MPPKLKIITNESVTAASASAASAASASASAAATSSESQFLSGLSPLERRVCAIAESHLESSFDLSRSSGYIAWKAKNA